MLGGKKKAYPAKRRGLEGLLPSAQGGREIRMIKEGAQLLLVVIALDKQKFVPAPCVYKGANKLPRLTQSATVVSHFCFAAYDAK
jgi:hypothetical protein